jgi:hypothetical protein
MLAACHTQEDAMTAHRKKRFLARAGSARDAQEIAKTLYKIPALVPFWTRCGNPRCRCTTGEPHGPYHALYWRDGGMQRRRYVPQSEVETVRAILAGRRRERAIERAAFADDLALWCRLSALRRKVDAELAALVVERE